MSQNIKLVSFIFYVENPDEKSIDIQANAETMNLSESTNKTELQFNSSSQLYGRKYVYFQDISNGVLGGEIQETDSFACTLAGARILVCELNSQLSREMLIGEQPVDVQSIQNVSLQERLKDDWRILWKHTEFYEMQEFLCDQKVYNRDDLSSYTFLVRLSETGLKNLQLLRNIRIVPSAELSPLILTQHEAKAGWNSLDELINAMDAFHSEQNKCGDTYIQFINKPLNWDRFVSGRCFVPVNAIYKGVFKRKFEHWHTFNVAKGEYPDDELISRARTLIVPGSGAGAWEDIEWVKNLSYFLKRVHSQFPHLKIVGICFGFQIIAQTFGGKVKQMEARKKDPHFHVIGNEELTIEPSFSDAEFVKDVFQSVKTKLYINKGHGDYVDEIPDEFFELIGSSNRVINEIVLSKDKRILCFQGHPEYAYEYSRRLMATFTHSHDKEEENDWNSHLQSEQFKILFEKPNDHIILVKLINSFIRQK